MVYSFLRLVSLSALVFFVTHAQELPPLKVLQLGDSYSSGNSARNERNKRDYVAPQTCFRSPSNWGSQYVDTLRDRYEVTYINRACSNSESIHIFGPRLLDDNVKCDDPTSVDEFFEPGSKRGKCNRLVRPQIEAVDSSVDVVIMTMGGNDVFFPATVLNCVLAFLPNSHQLCQETLADARVALPILENNIQEGLLAIWRAMGETGRIITFAYPHIVADLPKILKSPHGEPYDAVALVRSFTTEGNTAMERVVANVNQELGINAVTYFDGAVDLFAGHEPDPKLGKANKDGWIKEFQSFTLAEIFHPNRIGHEKWGEMAASQGLFGPLIGVDVTSRSVSANKPYAWIGESYSGKVGRPISFSAKGSYGKLVKYEWDFDGDGTFDATTQEPCVKHLYNATYEGKVRMRATSSSGSIATAEAYADINERGVTLRISDLFRF